MNCDMAYIALVDHPRENFCIDRCEAVYKRPMEGFSHLVSSRALACVNGGSAAASGQECLNAKDGQEEQRLNRTIFSLSL